MHLEKIAEMYYVNLRTEAIKFEKKIPGIGHRQANIGHHNLLQNFFYSACSILKIKRFFELGAHEATASLTLAKNIKDIKVFAFEANPHTFNIFKESVSNSINYINQAISTGESAVELQIPIFDENNPNYAPGNASLLMREDNLKPVRYEKIEVPATTIDKCLSTTDPISTKTALWLDLEGFVWQVLNSSNDLSSVEIIYTELEDEAAWVGQKTVIDVISVLLKHDFIPIAFDLEYKQQYNGIFLKRNAFQNLIQSGLITEYKKLLENL
jgi:FkbM family methyltransferase